MTATTMAADAAKPTVNRDRFGRPYVTPPDGGNAKPYTRATTLAGVLDDRWNLERWQQRMVAVGLSERNDLYLQVAASRNDKKALDSICEKAIEAAKGSAGANTGTAIHELTELIDRGEELPPVPADAAADLEAYRQTMAGVEVVAIEQFCVLDDLQVGGTFDRLVRIGDRYYIADIKTSAGALDWALGSIAIQLALYSRGQGYNPATGERYPLPDVDQNAALVIHLPVGEARCEPVWVNIAHGWEAAQIAMRVRAWRKHAKNGLVINPQGG